MDSVGIHQNNPESGISTSNNPNPPVLQRFEYGRKRKLSNGPDSTAVPPDAKYQLVESGNAISVTSEILSQESGVNLLDLSDEILLMIFQHLDSNSLIPLSTTCIKLHRLVADKTLWTEADFTTKKLNTCEVQHRVKYLQPVTTKTLKLRGMTSFYPVDTWKMPTVSPAILKMIGTRCPLLERLEFTEAYLDMNEISIIMFPYTIRSLVLRKCSLSLQNMQDPLMLRQHQMRSFLSNIYKHLVQLEELTIEYCTWFDTHDFMVLSKLPNLRYLSLRGCANIKDSVPYASLATRFGFKKLEVLDLRDTPVSDSDVSCFNIVHSLKELWLQCPEHLRTENGLHEYNEAERQRVEQLHRLAAHDLHQNYGDREDNANPVFVEAPDEGAAVPPPIPPPRHGIFDIRVVHGNPAGQAIGNLDHLIRIIRARENPPHRFGAQPHPANLPNAEQVHVVLPNEEDPMARQLPEAVPHIAAVRNENNNNNNADRQHIVRIINRDLLLQRREHLELEHPHRQHEQGIQMNAANQRVLNIGANLMQRPRAPRLALDDRAEPRILEDERVLEPHGLNVHMRFHGIAAAPPNNNLLHNYDQAEPAPQLPQQQQHNNPPPRILPHVIIMPGHFQENFQELIHRPGNGNHQQLFVNLGIGQVAPNYVSLVSDRSICAYGVSPNELGGALMGGLLHQNLTGLERLSVRNYKLVTDTSLDHLESAAPHLKILDVTGTSVTAEGVRNFRLSRPGCFVTSDYDAQEKNNIDPKHCIQVHLEHR